MLLSENDEHRSGTFMKFWRTQRSSGCVALLTPYDGGNLGDAAIQEALIANLRKVDPGIGLCGITLDPARTSALHHIPCYPLAVTSRPHYRAKREQSSRLDAAKALASAGTAAGLYRRLRRMARTVPLFRGLKILADETRHAVRSYRLLRDVDVLVVAGGGQLDDEWGGCWAHPYSLLKWTVLARAAGSSVVFLSAGACRMESRLTQMFLKRALSLACYRSYRDHESRRLALALTPSADGPVVPDLAFSLPALGDETGLQPNPARMRVGVSPIAYAQPGLWPTENAVQYEHYMTHLAHFVESLLRRGIFVTLFSSSSPDEQLFPDLCARLDPGLEDEARRRLSASDVTSLHDLLSLLRSFDFVVASRLHGLLLSFVAGKPAVAVSYDRKVRCLMEEMDQTAYCLDIQSVTSDGLLAAFLDLKTHGDQVTAKLSTTRLAYDELLQSQYRLVGELLAQRSGSPRRAHAAVVSDDQSCRRNAC